jgi:hypothetical protein
VFDITQKSELQLNSCLKITNSFDIQKTKSFDIQVKKSFDIQVITKEKMLNNNIMLQHLNNTSFIQIWQ